MNPIFLWSLANGTEMISVLLWSKVTIVTNGPRVSVDVHQTADAARTAALKATEAAEELGLWLIGVHGHRGWEGLPSDIATAHQLHILGRQTEALAVVVDGIANHIVTDGVDLDD